MMCCIIAAYLYARMLAALRGWAVYWGLLRPSERESDAPRLLRNLRGKGPLPSPATGAITLLLVGITAVTVIETLQPAEPLSSAGMVSDRSQVSAMPRLSQLIGISSLEKDRDLPRNQP